MATRTLSRQLALLSAGLAVGAGSAWTVRQLTASPAAASPPAPVAARPASPSRPGTPLPAPGPSLVLPPLLAAEDADAALAAFLELPPLVKDAPAADVEDRLGRLRALLTILPDSHFERLVVALAVRTGGAEAKIRRFTFDIWTEHDAPAATRWAMSIVPGEAINAAARARYLSQAVAAWSRDDFAAAYAWTGAIADANIRRDLASQLLGQLAAKDVKHALALAQTGDEEFAKAAKSAIFSSWAERDPAAALQSLGAELYAGRDQEWRVQQALAAWVGRDPKAAIDWAVAQPVPDGQSYRAPLNSIAWQLVEKPESIRPFIDLLTSRDDIPGRNEIRQQLFGSWARKDGSAALAWLDTVSDVAQRSDLVSQALGYIEQSKQDDYMALVQKLPDPADRAQKISERLADWAKTDPEAALDWIGQHDGPELAAARRKVEGALIGGLARTDLDAALARWQSLPADAARDEVSVQLASSWAKTDPAAATRWLMQQVSVSAANGMNDWNVRAQMQSVSASWARKDPAGYLAWTETLADQTQRENAINALNNHYWFGYDDRPDPPPRAAYAGQLAQIQDPELRDRVLGAHLSIWLRSDVKSARAWIESNDALSPEVAARLLTQNGAND